MALLLAADHQVLRRLARRLGIVEPMAPMASVFYYRASSDATPITKYEAHRIAVSHAETLGLQGEPRGFSVHNVGWAYYNKLVGQWASGMGRHKVWVVTVTGEIKYREETYPYMAVVLDLSGNLMCASFYPPGAAVPFKPKGNPCGRTTVDGLPIEDIN